MKRYEKLDHTPEQEARIDRMLLGGEREPRDVEIYSSPVEDVGSKPFDYEAWFEAQTAGMTDEQKARFRRILDAPDAEPHERRGRVRRRTQDNSID